MANFNGTYVYPGTTTDGNVYDCCDDTRLFMPVPPVGTSFATGTYQSVQDTDDPSIYVEMLNFSTPGQGIWLRPWTDQSFWGQNSAPLVKYEIVVNVDLPTTNVSGEQSVQCSVIVTQTATGKHIQVSGVASKAPNYFYLAKVKAERLARAAGLVKDAE